MNVKRNPKVDRQIPAHLRGQFFAHMDAHNDEGAGDGAWWAMMEEAAHEFIKQHDLADADFFDAVHQWLNKEAEREA